MSYTPPAGNAVAFSWDGTASYTPPAGGAVGFDWSATPPGGGGTTGNLTFAPSSPYTLPAQTAANFTFPANLDRVLEASALAPATTFGTPFCGLIRNLTFAPSSPYSLPPQSTADFQFDIPKTGYTTGFTSTAFGTANATQNQRETAEGFTSTAFGQPAYGVLLDATGFTSTSLGEPRLTTVAAVTAIGPGTAFGAPLIHYNAVGFAPTAFGVPASPQDVILPAEGFSTTAFGAPAQTTICQAESLGPVTIIPGAFRALDQYAQAEGFSNTRFGEVIGFRPFTPLVNQTAQASGIAGAAFGVPSTPVNATGVPMPWIAASLGVPRAMLAYSFTLYGTPTARMDQAAQTVGQGTAMGSPSAITGGMAEAIMFTAFGQPSVVAGRLASAVPRRARFGTPKATKTGEYRAYGLNCGRRFGRPTAFSRINYPAQGLPPSVMFGTIQALQVHRARHQAPGTQFGEPLLLRTPTC